MLKLGRDFDRIERDGISMIKVGAATPFSKLIKYCCDASLGGLENLAGIPGSLGGMIAMNASAHQRAISDALVDVDIFSAGKVLRLPKEKIRFIYRGSSLSGKIILGARFLLREERFVREKAADMIKEKMAKQDYAHPSFGCVFKNPEGFSAGYLIDACGLKGMKKNDAQISKKHANFIINLGKARYRDVDYLINKAREAVNKRFNIMLQEEVIRWT